MSRRRLAGRRPVGCCALARHAQCDQQGRQRMSPTSPPNIGYGYPTPGPQTPNSHAVLDSVFFVDDDAWDELVQKEKFDYIVIGSSVNAYAFCERILGGNP